MKTSKKINAFIGLIPLLIFFLGVTGIFGQGTVIEKKDFNDIIKKDEQHRSGKSFRSNYLSETFSDKSKAVDALYETIYETIPPDRSRYISISKVGKEINKSETITIGPRRYNRLNDGDWSEKQDQGLSGSGGGAIITYGSYKRLKKARLGKKSVTIYEKVIKTSDYGYGDGMREEIHTTSYWITLDGIILKVLEEIETVGTSKLVRNTRTYEYDAKIRIEAPKK